MMDIYTHTHLSLSRARVQKNSNNNNMTTTFVLWAHTIDQKEIYIRIRRTACLFIICSRGPLSLSRMRLGKKARRTKKACLHNCMTSKTLFIFLQRKKSFLFPQRPFFTFQRMALYYILFPYIYTRM